MQGAEEKQTKFLDEFLVYLPEQGFGNGLAIVTARSYGAGDENLLKRSISGAIVIGLLVVVTLMILTLIKKYDLPKLGKP